MDHDMVMNIAQGRMDPVSKEEFVTSECDNKVVDKICGKSGKGGKGSQTPGNSQASRKSAFY
jgi:hypothetical protein